jgi:hypothetical protein
VHFYFSVLNIFIAIRNKYRHPKGKKKECRGIVVNCKWNIEVDQRQNHSAEPAAGAEKSRNLIEWTLNADTRKSKKYIVSDTNGKNYPYIFCEIYCACFQDRTP